MYILLKFNNEKFSSLDSFLNLNEENENKLIEDKKYLVFQKEDKKTFERLNKEGYNVYKTLNTFIWNRRIASNLDKFKKILIDFDKNDFDSYIELIERVNKLKNKFNIAPTEILKTYKWYHYIYSFDKELEYLDIEQYTNFSNFIVNLLNWDKKAHQVTWIYKVPGYLDMKNNRKFLIEKETGSANDKLITKKVIEKIIWEKVKSRKDIIEKTKIKKQNQKEMTTNYSKSINQLNFKDFILPKLIEAWYSIEIDENWKIDNTSWINISKDWFVNDFSHWKESWENRANWNYNFLLNYIFEWNYPEFMKFCSIHLGVKRIWNWKIEIPKEIVNVITKKEFKMWNFVNELNIKEDELMIDAVSDMFIASEKLVLDNVKKFSNSLFQEKNEWDVNKIIYSNSIINTLLGVIWFSKNSKEVMSLWDSTYKFNIEDLLSFFKLDNHINNRKNLMMLLVSSSRLQFLRKYEWYLNWEATKWYEVLYSPLQIMYFWLWETWKSHVVLKIIDSKKWNHYLPKEFFNINQKVFDNQNNYNYLTLHISELLEKKDIISFSFEKIVEMAWLKIKESNPRITKSKIKSFLEKLKSLKVIKNYKFEKNWKVIILWKLFNG